MTKANEKVAEAMAKGSLAAYEDKEIFVHNLGVLLSQTRENVKEVRLLNDGLVAIVVKTAAGIVQRKVNIKDDSYLQIIVDVANHV